MGDRLELRDLEVLVVDCQATAAAPRGRLIEIGWARATGTLADRDACLVRLAPDERLPAAVARITGISDAMLRTGIDAASAWARVRDVAAQMRPQPTPTVIHFARFEEPFLRALAGGTSPLDVVCTHEIARRLLPDLPRRSLRALAGYFGRAVGSLRRASDHVEATAFVWRELLAILEREGVTTWRGLHDWLAVPSRASRHTRRVWPMPRSVRLSTPDAPGIYRLLRTNGDVLYVGKAASLRHRVNSHFRHQRGVHERALEMLSQARDLSFEVAGSALEAALLETDEIKRLRPPYNVALADDGRTLWFAAPDLGERSDHPSARCRLGPFPSRELLDQFAAFARAERTALGRGRWAPDPAIFEAGYARLRTTHPEFSMGDLTSTRQLLRLGTRLWREGRRDRDLEADEATESRTPAWTPDAVQLALEWLALRAAHARRRARWLTSLAECAIVWREPDASVARLLVLACGDVTCATDAGTAATPPIPPGRARPRLARHADFTVARFDRLRVLSTEIKRLVTAGAPVAVRFGAAPPLTGPRLATTMKWV